MNARIIYGDVREQLQTLGDGSVDCIITSPPYFGLRDYRIDGQIGLEESPEEFVAQLRAVFAECKRVLSDDGNLWLNLGDSYSGSWKNASSANAGATYGLKPKDLIGIPWMTAFALRSDGWYLRRDIIWSKPNPMPESVTDRCTSAHEYIFHMTKSRRYFYDADAIKDEPKASAGLQGSLNKFYSGGKVKPKTDKQRGHDRRHAGFNVRWDSMTKEEQQSKGANKRSVWTVPTRPFKEAHFATFPESLIEPCILAGCPEGGTVLDPFSGAGTTGVVALRSKRNYIGIELNPEYAEMSRHRLAKVFPMFCSVA